MARPGTPRTATPSRYRNDGVLQPGPASPAATWPPLAFATPSRRAVFHARPYLPAAELPDGDYPLLLNTGRLPHRYTMTKTGRVFALTRLDSGPFVEIHPADAAALAVLDGQQVELRSGGAGRYAAVVTDRVRPGSTFVPFHWNDEHGENLTINALTSDAVDPVSLQPEAEGVRGAAAADVLRPGVRTNLPPAGPRPGSGCWASGITEQLAAGLVRAAGRSRGGGSPGRDGRLRAGRSAGSWRVNLITLLSGEKVKVTTVFEMLKRSLLHTSALKLLKKRRGFILTPGTSIST